MRHAKLIHSFNSNTLKFIENWNSGYYNVKGFQHVKSDIKNLYLIKFFIEYYKKINISYLKRNLKKKLNPLRFYLLMIL